MEQFFDIIRQAFPLIYYSLFGLREILDVMIEEFGIMLTEIRRSIFRLPPSFLGVIDAILRFTTQIMGLLLSSTFYGMKRYILDGAKEAGIGHTVIRTDKALEFFLDAQIEWFQTLSGTNDTSLMEAVAQYLGRLLWTIAKRIKLIAALLNVTTEAQAIRVIYLSLRSGARLAIVFILIRLCVGVIAWFACFIAITGLMFNIKLMGKHVLQQKTKRRRIRVTDKARNDGRSVIRRRMSGGNIP